jgi:hypothetical protein
MTARKLCSYSCMAGLILSLSVACATPPKPAQGSTETDKPGASLPAAAGAKAAPAVAAPDALRAQAAEARKKAFDLGLKDALPDDYAVAEKAYSEGMAAYGVGNAASGASFSDAAAKFDDVVKRGLPMLVASEKERASRFRQTADKKGAAELFARLLSAADADFAKSESSESAGEYENALAGYRVCVAEYDVLYKLCDASSARSLLVSRDLAKWDPSNWSLAENKFESAKSMFGQDILGSADSVGEAILRYGIVKETAYGYYSADRKKASDAERERAVGIKSDVAVKDEYEAAAALYRKAQADDAAKDYEASSAEYDGAASAFAQAYAHAKEKMDAANGELSSLDSAFATVDAFSTRTR